MKSLSVAGVLLMRFIVLFLIEFKTIKENYNNPTSKVLGFLLSLKLKVK